MCGQLQNSPSLSHTKDTWCLLDRKWATELNHMQFLRENCLPLPGNHTTVIWLFSMYHNHRAEPHHTLLEMHYEFLHKFIKWVHNGEMVFSCLYPVSSPELLYGFWWTLMCNATYRLHLNLHVLVDESVVQLIFNTYKRKFCVCGSLSPRHGVSSGCGWRNGLRYGG